MLIIRTLAIFHRRFPKQPPAFKQFAYQGHARESERADHVKHGNGERSALRGKASGEKEELDGGGRRGVDGRHRDRVLRQLLLFHCGGELFRPHLLHRRREIEPRLGNAARLRHLRCVVSGASVRLAFVRTLRRQARTQENPGRSTYDDGHRNICRGPFARV